MRRVVVESPFAGDFEKNIEYARAAMADCIKRGEAPYASHLLFTQDGILDDTVPKERELGIQAGFEWGTFAMARVIYIDRGISHGMLRGIEEAHRLGQAVEFRAIPGCLEDPFVEMCKDGKVPANRKHEWIDWYVEAWHSMHEDDSGLHHFLGMRMTDYREWVGDPSILDVLTMVDPSENIDLTREPIAGSEMYRGFKLLWMPRPADAPWRGAWVVWVNMDYTYDWKGSDLDALLQKARARVDEFYEE